VEQKGQRKPTGIRSGAPIDPVPAQVMQGCEEMMSRAPPELL
jgi:hypothetical protein